MRPDRNRVPAVTATMTRKSIATRLAEWAADNGHDYRTRMIAGALAYFVGGVRVDPAVILFGISHPELPLTLCPTCAGSLMDGDHDHAGKVYITNQSQEYDVRPDMTVRGIAWSEPHTFVTTADSAAVHERNIAAKARRRNGLVTGRRFRAYEFDTYSTGHWAAVSTTWAKDLDPSDVDELQGMRTRIVFRTG